MEEKEMEGVEQSATFDPAVLADAVRTAVREEIEKETRAQKPPKEDPVSAVTGIERIKVGNDRMPNWQRRAVALFNHMAARTEGDLEGIEKTRKRLTEIASGVSDRMIHAERAIAENILKDSGYSGLSLERAMSTLTDGAGGYAVPTPMAAEIFVVIEQHGLSRQYSRGVTVTNKALDLSGVATKPTVYWKAEAAIFTESNPVLNQSTLTPSKLTALMSWTRELDEDQAVALLPVRTQLIGEGFAEQEDLAFFQGDGSTYGSTTGLLNLASANVVTMGSGDTAHTDIALTDLKDLRDEVSLARRRGAAFFMHPDIFSLLETEAYGKTATNHRGFTLDNNGEIARIWGFPVVLSEDMPATATTSTKFVVFGNPMSYVLRGAKAGIEIATSREGTIADGDGAVTFSAIQNDGVILAARERIAFATPTAFQAGFAVLRTAAS